MRKRFLGAMLLALGIGLFGGWGSAQANSVAEPTQSMLHVCWLKDAHVNPAACEVVRMPEAFEPAKAVVTSSVFMAITISLWLLLAMDRMSWAMPLGKVRLIWRNPLES